MLLCKRSLEIFLLIFVYLKNLVAVILISEVWRFDFRFVIIIILLEKTVIVIENRFCFKFSHEWISTLNFLYSSFVESFESAYFILKLLVFKVLLHFLIESRLFQWRYGIWMIFLKLIIWRVLILLCLLQAFLNILDYFSRLMRI